MVPPVLHVSVTSSEDGDSSANRVVSVPLENAPKTGVVGGYGLQRKIFQQLERLGSRAQRMSGSPKQITWQAGTCGALQLEHTHCVDRM